jgi:hypothetical protein
MTIAIRKGRAIVSALILALALFLGTGLTVLVPKANASGVTVTSAAVGGADFACRYLDLYWGSAPYAFSQLERITSYLSSHNRWTVLAIGAATGCPEAQPFFAPHVPHLAHYFGPWMASTRSSNGLTAAYWDRGNVCGVLNSSGGAEAVNSMYGVFSAYPLTHLDAKRAAIAGAMAFCPWHLGVLRAHFGG